MSIEKEETPDSDHVDEAAVISLSDSDFIRNYRTLNVRVLLCVRRCN